jgi:hypothetical protein
MFLQTRFRNTPAIQPVYISLSEIERQFYPLKGIQIDKELKTLADLGELNITKQQQGKKEFVICTALKPGPINLSILSPKPLLIDALMHTMKQHLALISLPTSALSTEYFNMFLKHKEEYLDLFFRVDDFSGRVHTPVTSFKSDYRKNILIEGTPTCSFDVCTMQPLLLSKILTAHIGQNEFSEWINAGKDIYEIFRNTLGFDTRDKGKKGFFEVLFAPANDNLANIFGKTEWITWINQYKSTYEPRNPHSKQKPHSNLAWLLQTTEVKLMRNIWQKISDAGYPFLSVHDEIIVKKSDLQATEDIFKKVLCQEFQYFKITAKGLTELHNIEYKDGHFVKCGFKGHAAWEYG